MNDVEYLLGMLLIIGIVLMIAVVVLWFAGQKEPGRKCLVAGVVLLLVSGSGLGVVRLGG